MRNGSAGGWDQRLRKRAHSAGVRHAPQAKLAGDDEQQEDPLDQYWPLFSWLRAPPGGSHRDRTSVMSVLTDYCSLIGAPTVGLYPSTLR